MLVDDVEAVKLPNLVVSSLVRLNTIDDAYRTRIDSLNVVFAVGFISGMAIVNRERRMPTGSVSEGFDQLPSQMVEGASEIVDCITSDQGQMQGRCRDNVNLEDVVQVVRTLLPDKSIRVGIAEGVQSRLEFADVLVGPFNFRPDVIESRSHLI